MSMPQESVTMSENRHSPFKLMRRKPSDPIKFAEIISVVTHCMEVFIAQTDTQQRCKGGWEKVAR